MILGPDGLRDATVNLDTGWNSRNSEKSTEEADLIQSVSFYLRLSLIEHNRFNQISSRSRDQ